MKMEINSCIKKKRAILIDVDRLKRFHAKNMSLIRVSRMQ